MDLILIDTSWLLLRSNYAFKNLHVELKNGDVLPSGHLYGVVKTLRQIRMAYPESKIVFCLDGHASRGKELDPAYKANRERGGYDPFTDLGVLVNMVLTYPNTSVMYHKQLEADELISSVVYWARTSRLYDNVYIFSADNDMLQLLGEKTYFANAFVKGAFSVVDEKAYYNDEKWFKKFLCTNIKALPLFRALVGDASDNLSGFPRLRKKKAKEWAEEYLTAQALADDFKRRPGKFPDNFGEFIPKLLTNFTIMKLPTKSDLAGRGLTPNIYPSADFSKVNAYEMFKLYRMKSLTDHILSNVEVSDAYESELLALRDEINSNWKL